MVYWLNVIVTCVHTLGGLHCHAVTQWWFGARHPGGPVFVPALRGV